MENLGLNEIRDLFRDFFVSKGHYAGKSASLIPQNDKSLLIINSGMAPLKPYFAGVETPPSKRMTTCQKCIRTGDIDNVGKTARHGTFFEMLGNFSFGDYFKEQSLTWGWEFITEWLKMPKDRVWATVYQDDDEGHDIWVKSSLTEARSTAAVNRIANRAATATVILNSGTTYSPSFPRRKTEAIQTWHIRTSIPEWGWNVWPASCRVWTPSSISTPSATF